MHKITKLLLLSLTFIVFLHAESDANAGYAGAFLRMGLGARASAMGNSGVACTGDGFGIYYNPASLAFLREKQVALTYSFLSLDRQFHYAGISLPVEPQAGLGVAWLHAGVKNIEGRTSTGYVDEIYETGEDLFLISFANAFHPQVSVGLNFKILRNQMLDISATGLGFDLGVMYRPFEWLAAGLQLKDIMSGYTWNTQDLFGEEGGNYTEHFLQVVKVGLAIQPALHWMLSGDVEVSEENIWQTYCGAEYVYRNLAYLRAGMNNASPTFGAGLAYGFLANINTQLDYALLLGMVGEGTIHIFSWQFKF